MFLKNFIINKKIKRNKRNVKFHNFNTAKNIAVLYCIKNKNDYEKIKNFISDLKEKKINVSALGFVFKQDEIGKNYSEQAENRFFSEKHISKFGKIKEKHITDFIEKQNDILINLCTENNFNTEYVFALSKADFKVSGIADCKHAELNIDISQKKDLEFLTEQITYYLSTIKQV